MSGLFWELEGRRSSAVLSDEQALDTISSVVSELQIVRAEAGGTPRAL